MSSKDIIKNLPNNNRFYILVFSFLLSIFAVCWLRLQIVSDQLYYIQLEQVFGFLSIAFLYVTFLISPLQKIIGQPEWMKNSIFARRAIGVSALYFALLHMGVALGGVLGGFDNLGILPDRFVWSLLVGTIASAILFVMTLMSFDIVVRWLTFRYWKWLQRLAYIGGVLIMIHVWTIGAHTTSAIMQSISLIALTILFGLEAWRIAHFFTERYDLHKAKRYSLFLILWLIEIALLLGLAWFYRPVEAHMLSKDELTDSGAVLHITPDDDPIAGESASFLFDIKSTALINKFSVAKLTIIDDQQHKIVVQARVQGNAVAADYTFPRQGLYMITLSIEHEGKQTHEFMQSQRVNRGIINNVTISSTPLWAEIGLWCTITAALIIAIMAFWRRGAIRTYSKLQH